MSIATKERPVLFSGPMVRAILDGRKTQTRRVVKPQPPSKDWLIKVKHTGQDVGLHNCHGKWRMTGAVGVAREAMGDTWPKSHEWKCPYGKVGTQLWVRETWRPTIDDKSMCCIQYRSDESIRWQLNEHNGEGDPIGTKAHRNPLQRIGRPGPPWRPSIHMPRWASRITLEITGVRVERLNDICTEDAIAEGVDWAMPQWYGKQNAPEVGEDGISVGRRHGSNFATDNYKRLWESINGKESWAANPWVWVIEFRKV